MAQVITVFGSARTKPGTPDYDVAVELGGALARVGFSVANGGYGGSMEAVSRGAAEAGGHVIGVTTDQFGSGPNRWVTEEIRLPDWTARLFKLVELGRGYVVLPGGTGTLVELSVVWEWNNKAFFDPLRPVVLLGEYWQPVIDAVAQKEIWNHSPLATIASPAEAAAHLRQSLQS